MKTKEIALAEIETDDWFILGGRLYRVTNVTKVQDKETHAPAVIVEFHNPPLDAQL